MDNEKLNILKLLIGNQDKTYSMRQIALERKINYKSAYLNLKTLEKEKVINVQKLGNTTICSFNQTWDSSVFEVEYARMQELLSNKNFLIIYNRLAKINFACYYMRLSLKSNKFYKTVPYSQQHDVKEFSEKSRNGSIREQRQKCYFN